METETENVKIQLADVKVAKPISEPLAEVSVHLLLNSVQDARLGGIEFTLEYLNGGQKNIELFNPIDHVQYMLVDAEGYPIPSAPYVPRLLIQSDNDPQALLENKFLIVAIRENGKEKPINSELRNERINMVAGGRYEVTLRIQKIVGSGSPGALIALPPATYKLVLTCSLVTPAESINGDNPFRLLQSVEIPVELR